MPIRYVQIETTTVCNQRCVFCPVSTDRRAKMSMERKTLERILDGLHEFPVETIFLNGFNEPTFDSNLIEWVHMIHDRGYQIHLNSNGSGLIPSLLDRLVDAGLATININISTLDPVKYKQTRGNDDLGRVLPNVRYLLVKAKQSKIKVTLMMLGYLDDNHCADIKDVESEFSAEQPEIVICPIVNFAGSSDEYFPKNIRVEKLDGCSAKRLTDWLHFTPDGSAIICCHDYYAKYILGNIASSSAKEIYQGGQFETMRLWGSGEECAPADFICRACVMALNPHQLQEKFCQRCTLADSMGKEHSCNRCVVGGTQ